MIELKTTERRQQIETSDKTPYNSPVVIFLDFDGVLCTLRQSFAEGDLGQTLCYLNENCEANDLLFYFEDNELLKEYLIDIIYEDFYG